MRKSAYSLILSDEVIRRIDADAQRAGLCRSGLINKILAEYVSCATPETLTEHVFGAIIKSIDESDMLMLERRTGSTLSMKTALDFKYNPTIRYSVRLGTRDDGLVWELGIGTRARSTELRARMPGFYNALETIEKRRNPSNVRTERKAEKYVMTFALEDCARDAAAERICAHISTIDGMLKAYLGRRYDTLADMERDYARGTRRAEGETEE